ncbi:MAG: hypothetical protein J0M13_04960 [Candidatus Accumulibacter sp.]|nr:hypothetical protein [Candidatus Accumulibacter necessarius]
MVIEPDILHGGGRAKTPTGLLRRGWIEPAGDGHALKDAGYAVIGVGRFQASGASALIEDAARPLREANTLLSWVLQARGGRIRNTRCG